MEPLTKKRHRTGDIQTDFEEVKAAIEKRLFLGRLPAETEEDELKLVYGEFGALTEVKKVPGKGLAFVGYETWAAAHRALLATDGRTALKGHRDGQTLVASFAERTSSVGRGGGAHLAKGLDNSRVFVGGLPEDISEEDLRLLFQRFGELSGLSLLPAKSHRRCGFVNFSLWGEALDAVETLDATEYPGRSNGSPADRLTVVLAEPKPGSGGGGKGGYGGMSYAPYSGPPEANSTKRRRLDEYGNADPTGTRAEFENLKVQYISAVDRGDREDFCTELHHKLMAVRGQLITAAYTAPVYGSDLGYDASWQAASYGGGSTQWASQSAQPASGHGRGDPRSEKDAARLFIGGLPMECTDMELKGLVDQLTFTGAPQDTEVLECRVLPSRGCGYLKMSSWAAAEEALDALNNRDVSGWPHPLRAKWAVRKGSEGSQPFSPRGRSPPRSSGGSWSGSRSTRERGSSADDGDIDRHRLFIGQLQRGTANQTVAALFEPYGTVEECRMLEEKGVAYVTFTHSAQAKLAQEAMDKKVVMGVSRGDGLNVQFAKTR